MNDNKPKERLVIEIPDVIERIASDPALIARNARRLAKKAAGKRVAAIVKTPGVVGGRARLDGTRMPVWTIVGCWSGALTDEQILKMYPQLDHDDLQAVREYAREHTDEIARDLQEQHEDED